MAETAPLNPLDTIAGLDAAYRAGETRPSAVVRDYLDRIERLDPRIGAYQAVHAEAAMQAAEAADRAFAAGYRIGPFHGVPFALKDIFHLAGTVTTCGSKAMADQVSDVTGTVVRRLMAAGGIVLGKSKTVECAFGAWGTNRLMGTPWNAWDMSVSRTPGGSSSGSAAAVTAGLAVCGVGSDTGGSVRIPAAFCGLVGLKVTAGRLPLDGIMPLSHTLDTPGPITQTVLDALLMFDVMDGGEGGRIDRDIATGGGLYGALEKGVEGLRLGVIDDAERADCSADVLDAYDRAVDSLRALGAEIDTFNAPFSYGDIANQNGLIIAIEGYHNHGKYYGDPDAPMDEDVRKRMLAGRGVDVGIYLQALKDRQTLMAAFAERMRGYDALLTPSARTTALPVDSVDQDTSPTYFTRPFNFIEMCGVSVPTFLDPKGLPNSLQIAARANDEAMALRVAAALERTLPPIGRPVIA